MSQIKSPLISIVTVSLNSQKTIQRTIDSVKNQIYKNIEYIIIDGGSEDKTVSIIKNNSRMKTGLLHFPYNLLFHVFYVYKNRMDIRLHILL